MGDEAIQKSIFTALDCFAEPVIGPATSGRTRWLAMTLQSDRTPLQLSGPWRAERLNQFYPSRMRPYLY